MRIQEYTVCDLKRCLRPGQWFRGDPIPITKQRALSHVANPRAEPNDVALLVAYDGDTMVAHLGILPDKTFGSHPDQRIGWLTAWWANPDRKYAGLGLTLLIRAFDLYKGKLAASGFSSDTKAVCTATKKFVTIKELLGVSGFARLNLCHLLRKRLPLLAKFRTTLRAVDSAVNQYINLRQFSWQKRHKLADAFRIEYVPEMDQEADEFIRLHSSSGLTRRGARELNWVAKYPWVFCAPLARPPSFRFLSPVESRSVFNIKIYDAGDHLVAVLMLTVIDGHVIVPYCFHEGQASFIAQMLCHFLITQRAERLTIYQPELIEQLCALRFPWFWRTEKRREWIWSRECAQDGSHAYSIQDGDGDCAFTL